MARNTGNGSRIGVVKGRSQVFNPKNGKFVKLDKNGKFCQVKKDDKPFKAIRLKKKQKVEK
jgi:hypothetical protein